MKQELMKKMKATKAKTAALTKKPVEQITAADFEALRADFQAINRDLEIITKRLEGRI
ncbi:MAG: hypothetical protein AAF599_04900 [Bacteroidota bacterium]